MAVPQDALLQESEPRSAGKPPPTAEGRIRKSLRAPPGQLRIYQHSNLLYWWPLWGYGYVCAALTYVQGIGIKELAAAAGPDGGEKVILFYPSPWMGV